MANPKKEFFQAPNAIFDNPDLDLSNNEKLVYLYLVRCSNQDEENEAYPGYGTIAKKCSISKHTAMRAVKGLEDKGYISVTRRPKSNYDNQSNLYKVYELPSATVGLGLVHSRHQPSITDAPYKEPYINNQGIKNYLRNKSNVLDNVSTLEGDPSKTPLPRNSKNGSNLTLQQNATSEITHDDNDTSPRRCTHDTSGHCFVDSMTECNGKPNRCVYFDK